MTPRLIAAALVSIGLAAPVYADGFQQVPDKSTFLSLLKDRDLTRLGIRLKVTPAGEIEGRAFGTPVNGSWQWNGGYFCRDLYFGERDLGPNCQMVKVRGNTLRFISDRGAGEYADLRLD